MSSKDTVDQKATAFIMLMSAGDWLGEGAGQNQMFCSICFSG